jgi:hypothetical protein
MRRLSLDRHLLLLWLLLVAPACANGSDARADPSNSRDPTSPVSEPVVREILGQVDSPPGASGRRLSLVRYTIAPGAELAPHVHPGAQMAAIESGSLTYHVLSGTAVVHRAVGPDGVPGLSEELIGPAETTLRAGDAVIEDGEMLHFGSNRAAEPVVILATLLTDPGAGLAVAVPPLVAE